MNEEMKLLIEGAASNPKEEIKATYKKKRKKSKGKKLVFTHIINIRNIIVLSLPFLRECRH